MQWTGRQETCGRNDVTFTRTGALSNGSNCANSPAVAGGWPVAPVSLSWHLAGRRERGRASRPKRIDRARRWRNGARVTTLRATRARPSGRRRIVFSSAPSVTRHWRLFSDAAAAPLDDPDASARALAYETRTSMEGERHSPARTKERRRVPESVTPAECPIGWAAPVTVALNPRRLTRLLRKHSAGEDTLGIHRVLSKRALDAPSSGGAASHFRIDGVVVDSSSSTTRRQFKRFTH